MSRVYFHSPQNTAVLRGSERAYLRGLCTDVFNGVFDLPDGIGEFEKKKLGCFARALGSQHYLVRNYIADGIPPNRWLEFKSTVETFFAVSDDLLFNQIDAFGLVLNTAYLAGSDAIKLAARIHGQCEVHAWVDGHNRSWLADIIQKGLVSGIYRQGQGWDEVIELLRSSNADPVVMSYSVCDQFPNPGIAGWTPPLDEDGDADWDEWYNLDEAVRWHMAMEGLRGSGGGLELKPQNWNTFYFAHGWDAFKLNTLLEWGANSIDMLQVIQFFKDYKSKSVDECWMQTVSFVESLSQGD